MATVTHDGLTGIRLLICMAKADGEIRPEERFELEDALAGVELPQGLTLTSMLNEENDPAALAVKVTDTKARDSIYASVFAMAHVDRDLGASEQRLLGLLRNVWSIHPDEEQHLANILDSHHETEHESAVTPAATPAERMANAKKIVMRYALITGITGAIPIPLVPSLIIVPVQVKMVHDIARTMGQKIDKNTIQLMFETFGVGSGCQLAVYELCKLIPGIGSAVGAGGAFAATYGLGQVACVFYEGGGKVDLDSLKPVFERERKSGREEYEKHKAAIHAAQEEHSGELRALAHDLQQGRITPGQYEEKVDEL
jgi:uncharacterized protein (DUF697 family)